jgi:hypothetical protein
MRSLPKRSRATQPAAIRSEFRERVWRCALKRQVGSSNLPVPTRVSRPAIDTSVDAARTSARATGPLEWGMAKLALIYGMRLLPADELEKVGDAEVTLKSGKKAQVTMHLLEGGEDEIRKQLMQSLDAFFEFYPEI